MAGQWGPDPWGEAPLRWHDGKQWTAVVGHPRTPPPTAVPDEQLRADEPAEPQPAPSSRKVRSGVPALAVLGLGVVAALGVAAALVADLGTERSSTAATVGTPAPTTVPITAPAPATEPTATSAPADEPAPEAASAGPVPQTTVAPAPDTTPPPAVDPALVDACAAFTPVAAFMGMPAYQQLWNDSDQNPDTLRANCEAMPPEFLAIIAEEKQAVQSFFDAAGTTTP